MEQINLEKGDTIGFPGQSAQRLWIVFSGKIQICTTMDGKEYIVETLPRGSIINSVAFLIDDTIDTYNKAVESVVLYFVTIDVFIEETVKYP